MARTGVFSVCQLLRADSGPLEGEGAQVARAGAGSGRAGAAASPPVSTPGRGAGKAAPTRESLLTTARTPTPTPSVDLRGGTTLVCREWGGVGGCFFKLPDFGILWKLRSEMRRRGRQGGRQGKGGSPDALISCQATRSSSLKNPLFSLASP